MPIRRKQSLWYRHIVSFKVRGCNLLVWGRGRGREDWARVTGRTQEPLGEEVEEVELEEEVRELKSPSSVGIVLPPVKERSTLDL